LPFGILLPSVATSYVLEPLYIIGFGTPEIERLKRSNNEFMEGDEER